MTSGGAAVATSSRGRRAPAALVACAALVALAAVVPIAYLTLRALSADAAARALTPLASTLDLAWDTALLASASSGDAPRRRPVRMARRTHGPPGTTRLGRRSIASARDPELRRRARAPRSARPPRTPAGDPRAARRRTTARGHGLLGLARRPDAGDVPVRVPPRRIGAAKRRSDGGGGCTRPRRTPVRVFWRVTLPALRPSLAAASLLVALYVLSDFGVVSLMGYSTLTTGIYVRYDRCWHSSRLRSSRSSSSRSRSSSCRSRPAGACAARSTAARREPGGPPSPCSSAAGAGPRSLLLARRRVFPRPPGRRPRLVVGEREIRSRGEPRSPGRPPPVRHGWRPRPRWSRPSSSSQPLWWRGATRLRSRAGSSA